MHGIFGIGSVAVTKIPVVSDSALRSVCKMHRYRTALGFGIRSKNSIRDIIEKDNGVGTLATVIIRDSEFQVIISFDHCIKDRRCGGGVQ